MVVVLGGLNQSSYRDVSVSQLSEYVSMCRFRRSLTVLLQDMLDAQDVLDAVGPVRSCVVGGRP